MDVDISDLLTDMTVPIRERLIIAGENHSSDDIVTALRNFRLPMVQLTEWSMMTSRKKIIEWGIKNIGLNNFVIVKNAIFFTDQVAASRFVLWTKSVKK